MTARAESIACQPEPVPAASPGWSGITGLLSMILWAVDSVDWIGKRGHFVCGGSYYLQETLMRILTYCAVTGAQTADQIAAKLVDDRSAKFLCGGEPPDAKTLLQFADAQSGPFKRCVSEFWKLSSMVHFGQEDSSAAPLDDCVARRLDRWLDPVRHPEERLDDLRGHLLIEFAKKLP
jgi:hypothetical protein